jgi:hypothetical protein
MNPPGSPAFLLSMRTALLTLVLLATASAEEPGAERLAAQLGDPDFSRREAAESALRALGEQALPALEQAWERPDPEVRERAGRLLRTWGWISPLHRDLLTPALLSALRGSEAEVRRSAAEQVLAAWERGQAALADLYDTAPLRVAVEPRPGRRTFEIPADAVVLDASLRNRSRHPGWVGGVSLHLSFREPRPFGRPVRFLKADGSETLSGTSRHLTCAYG